MHHLSLRCLMSNSPCFPAPRSLPLAMPLCSLHSACHPSLHVSAKCHFSRALLLKHTLYF